MRRLRPPRPNSWHSDCPSAAVGGNSPRRRTSSRRFSACGGRHGASDLLFVAWQREPHPSRTAPDRERFVITHVTERTERLVNARARLGWPACSWRAWSGGRRSERAHSNVRDARRQLDDHAGARFDGRVVGPSRSAGHLQDASGRSARPAPRGHRERLVLLVQLPGTVCRGRIHCLGEPCARRTGPRNAGETPAPPGSLPHWPVQSGFGTNPPPTSECPRLPVIVSDLYIDFASLSFTSRCHQPRNERLVQFGDQGFYALARTQYVGRHNFGSLVRSWKQ